MDLQGYIYFSILSGYNIRMGKEFFFFFFGLEGDEEKEKV